MAGDDDTSFSSQDPLAGSLSQPPSPTKVIKRTSPTKVVSTARGEKRKFEDVILTPPAPRSARRSSSSSPWRLRITVEAENSEVENDTRKRQARPKSPRKRASPQKQPATPKRLETRTTTTTVPLNDGNATMEQPKRGRGRPRKSAGATPGRPATPAAAKDKGKGGKQTKRPKERAGAEKDMEARLDEGSVPERAGEDQRPHACRDKEVDLVSNCSHSSPISQGDDLDLRSARRKKLGNSFDIAMDSDVSLAQPAQTGTSVGMKPVEENLSSVSRTVNAASKSDDGHSLSGHRALHNTNSAAPNPTSFQKSTTRSQPPDPTNLHTEFDSIIESEGFSVISLSSVPSAQQRSSHSDNLANTRVRSHAQGSMAAPNQSGNSNTSSDQASFAAKLLSRSGEPGEQMASHNASSQAPFSSIGTTAGRHEKSTKPASSAIPRLSTMMQACAPETSLKNAGAVSHLTSQHKLGPDPNAQPDGLFDGFREGTRRELRAGLRLGEELLKRQQLTNAGTRAKARETEPNHSSGANTPSDSDPSDSDDNHEVVDEAAVTNDMTDIWQLEARSSTHVRDASELSQVSVDAEPTEAAQAKAPTWEEILQNTARANDQFSPEAQQQSTAGNKRKTVFTPLASSRKSPKNTPSDSPRSSSSSREGADDEGAGGLQQDAGQEDEDDHREEDTDDDEAVEEYGGGYDDDEENVEEDEDGDDDDDMEVEVPSPTHPFNNPITKSVQKRVTNRFLGDENSQRSTSPTPSSHRSVSTTSAASRASKDVRHSRSIIKIGPQTRRPSTPKAAPSNAVTGFLRSIVDFVFQWPTINIRWPLTEPQQILGIPREDSPPPADPKIPTFKPCPFTGPRDNPEPLHVRHPLTETHFEKFEAIYLAAQADPAAHPLYLDSAAFRFRGVVVESRGWEKALEDWQLAAVDEYMALLARKGVDGPGFVRRCWPKITAEDVVYLSLAFWMGQVLREETELFNEVVGEWDETMLDTRPRVLERQRRWKLENGLL